LSNLKGKRILITGSTGHIGSHLVVRLASEGSHLLVLARDGEKLDQLIKNSSIDNIEPFLCNLTQPKKFHRLESASVALTSSYI